MKVWVTKRKFTNEKGKEFTQYLMESLGRRGELTVGRSLGFDLNFFWKPKMEKTLFRWGMVREKAFLFAQYRVLEIKDVELFRTGDEEELGKRKVGERGYVRFGG